MVSLDRHMNERAVGFPAKTERIASTRTALPAVMALLLATGLLEVLRLRPLFFPISSTIMAPSSRAT